MSDFFKTLRSLFIVEETIPEKEGKEITNPNAAGPDTSAAAGDIVPDGKVSSRFVEVLLEAMRKNNLEGIDYLEYRQSLDSLQPMEMDEETRHRSAYAMAQTMGASIDKLIGSAQHYLQVLEEENKKFGLALERHRQLKVERRDKEAAELTAEVEGCKEEIARLQGKIKEAEVRLKVLAEERLSAEGKIESTRKNFGSSYLYVRERIETDVEKMKQFLK